MPVRWAGIAGKVVELLLGAAHGTAALKNYNLRCFLAKGLSMVLAIPLKRYLVVRYVPGTTLAAPIDWFNLLGPSILALFIIQPISILYSVVDLIQYI